MAITSNYRILTNYWSLNIIDWQGSNHNIEPTPLLTLTIELCYQEKGESVMMTKRGLNTIIVWFNNGWGPFKL